MNAVSDSGTPVLCLAARHGRCDVLNALLSYGAQIDNAAKYVLTYVCPIQSVCMLYSYISAMVCVHVCVVHLYLL